jgi:hypothetical protein
MDEKLPKKDERLCVSLCGRWIKNLLKKDETSCVSLVLWKMDGTIL